MELNAFEPVLFKNLFESLDCMAAAVKTLTVNCIAGITANRELSEQRVRNSSCLATALCPIVGYKKAAEIAKEAMKTGKAVRDLALEAGCMEEELDVVLDLYRMTGVWRPSELESLKRGGV